MRMDQATQINQTITVSTPLGEDILLFRNMTTSEQLSRLFQYELELLSSHLTINLDDILGQNVTVHFQRADGQMRYFNGYVSRFSQAGNLGEFVLYKATLRPWFWFLTRTADCRIFQQTTVPDIIAEIFRENNFTDFEDTLIETYRTWDYCVQYRETDFNFISRLMEQEGIYYYFKHEDGKHTLVLCDSISSHSAVPGYEDVPFFPLQKGLHRERDHVYDWSVTREIQPGAFATKDFDFKKPRASLSAQYSIPRNHAHSEYEVYDYPGEYTESADGNVYARMRIEEVQIQHELAVGQGNANGLATGALFKLTRYARGDQNREYLIASANYQIGPVEYESTGNSSGAPKVVCNFAAINSFDIYRPLRITPKPVVQGPQTAIVVGKAGEEIWTDEYGRVKVQFHWDRYGKSDENSSCWVRVAQLWAGTTWGGIHIPRIGQEVIVEFLEGDPDRPIITGRVYNYDNKPPYALPANATQSGIKSRSSKGGGEKNFNELRFEDKKGEEQIYIHAEKNQDNVVENDETTEVGHDRTENVGKDETITIGNNRTENVGKDESITIGNNRTESVGKDESISIGNNRSESVGKDETVSIGNNRSHDVGKNDMLNVGKNLGMVAGDQIVLQTGQASIVMKKNGDIVIKGNNITLQGSGKITAKASGDVTIKGSKIKQN